MLDATRASCAPELQRVPVVLRRHAGRASYACTAADAAAAGRGVAAHAPVGCASRHTDARTRAGSRRHKCSGSSLSCSYVPALAVLHASNDRAVEDRRTAGCAPTRRRPPATCVCDGQTASQLLTAWCGPFRFGRRWWAPAMAMAMPRLRVCQCPSQRLPSRLACASHRQLTYSIAYATSLPMPFSQPLARLLIMTTVWGWQEKGRMKERGYSHRSRTQHETPMRSKASNQSQHFLPSGRRIGYAY
eukprot:363998-Chlamydomonas_euryale.AAC.13